MPVDKKHFEGWDRLYLKESETANLFNWLFDHFIEHSPKWVPFSYLDFKEGIVIAQSAQSGVGITTFVKCLECNAEKDITDYGIW